MKIKSTIIYNVKVFSSSYLLDKLTSLNIKVISLKKEDDYLYELEIFYKDKKLFENNFSSFKVLKINGLKAFFNKILFLRYTIISILISLIFFFFLSTRILIISINGNSNTLNNSIRLYLNDNNIKEYSPLPTLNTINNIKDDLYSMYYKELKTLEVYKIGNKILVNYSLKDKEIILPTLKGKMYSKYDALISKIEISSGNVLVKENMFVYKDTLLVDDYLYYKDQPIYVGTRGKIYGYVYMMINIDSLYYYSDEETFSYLLDKARTKVSSDFEEGDRIDSEKILSYKFDKNKDKSNIKILYTLYKNIVKT